MGTNIELLDKDHPIRKQAEQQLGKSFGGSSKRGEMEHLLQRRVVEAFRLKYPHFKMNLFAIPNGGNRNKATAGRLKAEGVLAGVWDMFFSVPRGTFGGCFIETKWARNQLSKSQREFRKANHEFYHFFVYRSFDEFFEKLEQYLNKGVTTNGK